MVKILVYDGYFKIVAYSREGDLGQYEVVKVTNAICLLLHNKSTDTVVLVKQKRFAMISDDNPEGYITEAVGGRFDRNVDLIDLIISEANEEIGAKLSEDDIELLNGGMPMATSPGMTDEKAYLAYASVDSSQIEKLERTFGVADEGEEIERIHLPVSEFLTMIVGDQRLYSMQQFLKAKLLQQKVELLEQKLEALCA